MSRTGLIPLGVKCEQCEIPFALSLTGAVGRREVERLPDPFEARCPLCNFVGIYAKSSISDLMVVQPQ